MPSSSKLFHTQPELLMTNATTARIVAAGAIGNVLEWYDFAIYGYFAAAIGRTFFPLQQQVAQVLAAFGIFAVGYLLRPIGGALIGHIGDRLGRPTALTFSVVAMAVPTFLVGVLPGYEVLGIMAPVLLTALRAIQGLSVGGEYTTSIVFMVERAPPGRRGLIGAMACCGAAGGILLGSATGAVLAAAMSPETLQSWGWRIPFILGLVVGVAGLLLRRQVQEAPRQGAAERLPFFDVVRDHRALLARLAGLAVFNAVGFYLLFVYIVSWLQLADGVAPAQALDINTASMLLLLAVMLGGGWLSDRVGRKPVLLGATAVAFLAAVPLFWLMHHPNVGLALMGQMGFALVIGMFLGAQPSLMVEATPAAVRCTAVALGYNVTLGLIGGTSPIAATWLVYRTGNDLSPAFLIMIAAAISFIAVRRFGESSRMPV
jgi:MFS transporter, MHS family, proline/betaine transporter